MTVSQLLSINCARITNITTMMTQINARLALSLATSASFRGIGVPLAYHSTTSLQVIHASTACNTVCFAKIAVSATDAFRNTILQTLHVSFANQLLMDVSFALILLFVNPVLVMGIGI